MTRSDEGLLEVVLPGYPLEVHERSQEQHEALMREFSLIAMDDDPEHHHVPRRLLELVDALRGRYGRVTDPVDQQREAALDRGDRTVDLVYQVPPAVGEGALELGRMLDEADSYCRRGELLTLAADPELVAFRWWYVMEFVRQAGGEPPRRWDPTRSAEGYRPSV